MLFLTASLFGSQLYTSTMEFIMQKTISLMPGHGRHIGKDTILHSLKFPSAFSVLW